jgi:hypothetical protein
MNGSREFPVDDRLLERLSQLPPFMTRESVDPGIEEKMLRDLCRRFRRRSLLVRFFQETAGDYWAPILVSILFCLLGFDLFRIIRLLLS